jgi:hypothetical protein
MENRIDRIERNIEEFTKGMLELKEAQMKTDAQQNRPDAQILELKEAQMKTDVQQNRTDAQILGLKEYHRQTEELLQKTIK